MHNIEVRKTLVKLGCVLNKKCFFALKSGRVAKKYINVDPLLTHPLYLHAVMNMMLRDHRDFEVIAGPAVGAIPLIYIGAEVVGHRHVHYTGQRSRINGIRAVFTDKSGDNFVLERKGFTQAVKGRKVIVVEDVTTTGESARKTADAIREAGGIITRHAFIWNRDKRRVNEQTMGAPVSSLVTEGVRSWAPGEHPHWGEWPLVTDVGHPGKFPDYKGPRITLFS
ncbi:MAG: hypothetical protein RLZZ480_249 [Candidatus Parcubacteria bacterium]